MRKILIAAILLLVSSCCHDDTKYSIAPDLQPYVDSFYGEAEEHGFVFGRENLIVRFADLDVTARSIRQIHSCDGNQITIEMDLDYFRNHSSECIESVMFHEFGHALLNREHSPYYSLMSVIIGESCYFNDPEARKLLIDELFSG